MTAPAAPVRPYPAGPETVPRGATSRIIRWLNRRSRVSLLVGSLALTVALGAANLSLAGTGVAFYVLYFLPVSIAAYFVGLGPAQIISLIAAAAWTWDVDVAGQTEGLSLVDLLNGIARLLIFLVVAGALASLRQALQHERDLARTDALTGAANSRAFREGVEHELLRSRRTGRPLSVVHFDLDGFKGVNDRQGHAEGDRVLRAVAETARRALRRIDLVARLGGDEFAVLLPETGTDGARMATTKLQQALDRAMEAGPWPVTFSIGLLTCLDSPGTVDDLLQRVDALTYQSKETGKNRITAGTVDEDRMSLALRPESPAVNSAP